MAIFLFLSPIWVLAQTGNEDRKDTQALREVVVEGSRYQKADDVIDINKIVQPVTIITRKAISMMGSRRLDEVLREQTGMAIVNDLGSGNRAVGLQMQGLGSAYIAILINGQPMAGRFNGNFDLSRISVAAIERIEIIKGASSSLYGCDALGGVINIITKQHITDKQVTAALRYGTYQTMEATIEGETPFSHNKGNLHLSADYYSTDGFNVNNQYLKQGQTAPPYTSFNVQGRASWLLSDVHTLNITGRLAHRNSTMDRFYGAQQFSDQLTERDLNAAAILNSQLASGTRLVTRYYFTRYATDQEVSIHNGEQLLQENRFVQSIHKLEVQAAHDFMNKTLSLIAGTGGDYQFLKDHADVSRNSMSTYFGFAQLNYQPSSLYDLTLGLRYDGNTVYGGQLNPTIGAAYQPAKWIRLKLSVGQGFKAPSYAQLYQVFTNMVQGYTVVGANVFAATAASMKEAGMIQQLWPLSSTIRTLKPETSTSVNLMVSLKPLPALEFSVNGFYNDIRNQIFSQQVGIMSNGQQLFSYFNIERSFTTGIESTLKWSPLQELSFTGGYQYLVAKDKGVADSIKAGRGKYGKVRATSGIRNATASDYFNLPGRSRHSANLQAFYQYRPWKAGFSLRVNYRGKYGFLDIDNNGFIDPYDVYVKSYWLLYAAVQKELLKNRVTLQVSIDNMLDYTDYLMPSQPGRVITAGITWKFFPKKNTASP